MFCSLLNDALSNSDYTAMNDQMIANNLWQETVMVLPQPFYRGNEKTMKHLSKGQRTGQDLKWAPPQYKPQTCSLEPTCSVKQHTSQRTISYYIINSTLNKIKGHPHQHNSWIPKWWQYCSLKPYPCITHLASLGTFGCAVRDDFAQLHDPVVNFVTTSLLNLIMCGTSPIISLFSP
jgi:hypothetical protein